MTGAGLLGHFEQMSVIRATERAAYDLFMTGEVNGTTHLASGHEAVAVGVSAALQPHDYVFATYRGHHHALARGASPEACLAELMSRSTGLCAGKGGSMHLTDTSVNMMGSYAIIGSNIALAVGAAWSAMLRSSGQISVAFFGDGATNIGAFHESVNLAAVWRLPVVFVCENNLYMEYTATASVTPVVHPAADRASAYAVPGVVVDGNDVEAVQQAAAQAVDRARLGDGPTILEALTYRHYGHSRADPANYRPAEEVAGWLERDPLVIARNRLLASGTTAAELDSITADAVAVVARAVEAARSAPLADVHTACTDVWADGSSTWRT